MARTPSSEVELRSWLGEVRAAVDGTGEADVPCAGCTACCRSGQFVHVGADEADTLAHVPPELLFPAPRSPAGDLLLGYDDQGRCPMLGPGGCTIYEHRPRTCRSYDCRVFAAAGITPEHPLVATAVERWTIRTADDRDRTMAGALRRAAAWLAEHPEVWPSGRVPGATGLALAALAVGELFVTADDPTVQAVRERVRP